MNAEKLLQYSMELSLLAQLLQCKQITEAEYQKIKIKLMKEYHELNKKLISQGWSITELELMYAEAELEFDSEENDSEVAFVLTQEEFQKITKES